MIKWQISSTWYGSSTVEIHNCSVDVSAISDCFQADGIGWTESPLCPPLLSIIWCLQIFLIPPPPSSPTLPGLVGDAMYWLTADISLPSSYITSSTLTGFRAIERRGTSHFYLNIIHKMEKAINGDKKFGAEDWFVWCLLTRTCKTAISHYQALRPAPLQLKCGDGEFLWFSSSALSAPLAQIVLGVLLGITSESVWSDSR